MNGFAACEWDLQETPSASRIAFDEAEIEQTMSKTLAQEKVDGQRMLVRAMVGSGVDAWVSHERYEYAVTRAKEMKEMALESAEGNFERGMVQRHWVFDDYDGNG